MLFSFVICQYVNAYEFGFWFFKIIIQNNKWKCHFVPPIAAIVVEVNVVGFVVALVASIVG